MKYIYTFWIIIYLVTPTYLPFCKLKATFYITKKQNHQPSKLIYFKSPSINCIYVAQHLQQWSNIIYFKSPSINCITNKQNQQPSVLIYFKTQSIICITNCSSATCSIPFNSDVLLSQGVSMSSEPCSSTASPIAPHPTPSSVIPTHQSL